MPNRNYQQGYRYEVKEIEYQNELGFWALRRRASKGPFDVVATDGTLTKFIEVKSYTNRKGSYKKSIKALKEVPSGPNVKRLLVVYGPIKRGVETPREEIEL